MKDIVKAISLSRLFIRPGTGFIKQHVYSNFDECSLRQPYDEARKRDRTAVLQR